MDKTGIWQSPNGWNFVPVDNLSVDNKTMYYIENASNDTLVLGINGDDGKFVKFINSEKATKFCKIPTLLLSVCTVDKSKVEISQNFVAFSEYINFNISTSEMDHGFPYFL